MQWLILDYTKIEIYIIHYFEQSNFSFKLNLSSFKIIIIIPPIHTLIEKNIRTNRNRSLPYMKGIIIFIRKSSKDMRLLCDLLYVRMAESIVFGLSIGSEIEIEI